MLANSGYGVSALWLQLIHRNNSNNAGTLRLSSISSFRLIDESMVEQ